MKRHRNQPEIVELFLWESKKQTSTFLLTQPWTHSVGCMQCDQLWQVENNWFFYGTWYFEMDYSSRTFFFSHKSIKWKLDWYTLMLFLVRNMWKLNLSINSYFNSSHVYYWGFISTIIYSLLWYATKNWYNVMKFFTSLIPTHFPSSKIHMTNP